MPSKTMVVKLPKLRSGVRVTSAGRIEVDGRKLFKSDSMKRAADALRRVPVSSTAKDA